MGAPAPRLPELQPPCEIPRAVGRPASHRGDSCDSPPPALILSRPLPRGQREAGGRGALGGHRPSPGRPTILQSAAPSSSGHSKASGRRNWPGGHRGRQEVSAGPRPGALVLCRDPGSSWEARAPPDPGSPEGRRRRPPQPAGRCLLAIQAVSRAFRNAHPFLSYLLQPGGPSTVLRSCSGPAPALTTSSIRQVAGPGPAPAPLQRGGCSHLGPAARQRGLEALGTLP